jgi:hypothetical protein
MNGPVVKAKITGTESTVKTKSTHSTSTAAKNSGVARYTGLPVIGDARDLVGVDPSLYASENPKTTEDV